MKWPLNVMRTLQAARLVVQLVPDNQLEVRVVSEVLLVARLVPAPFVLQLKQRQAVQVVAAVLAAVLVVDLAAARLPEVIRLDQLSEAAAVDQPQSAQAAAEEYHPKQLLAMVMLHQALVGPPVDLLAAKDWHLTLDLDMLLSQAMELLSVNDMHPAARTEVRLHCLTSTLSDYL